MSPALAGRFFTPSTTWEAQDVDTKIKNSISSVQSLSHVRLFVTPWMAAHLASLSIINSWVSSNSCPSSWWCHPTISSSVFPFFCLQSFPASGSYPMSQLLTWGSKSFRILASTSVLPMNTQDWFPLGLTGMISLQSRGLSEPSPIPQFKSSNFSMFTFLYDLTLTSIHDYCKKHSFD